MVLVTGNIRTWLIGMAASLIIFAVVYFTVIAPSTNTANQAIKSSEQQAQKLISTAQKQLSTAGSQAAAAGASGAASAVTSQAQQAASSAMTLASCVAAAGTDVSKVQACQAKYQP